MFDTSTTACAAEASSNMTNPESPSNGDQNVEKITYIGEVLNNIGTFTLSVWLPLELVDLCDALASNLDIVIDDGLKKPPKGSRNVTKWSSELFVSPRELRLSFRPPEEGPVSSSQKTPSLDMPLPRVIDVRSAKITVTDNILDAKFTLAAGPDTSNGWRREIRVPHRLTASQVEHTTGISCASCGKSVLKKKYRPAGAEEKEEDYFYRSVDLPSEHWYELVECWMCHQEDYGRNGRFEKSTQAAPGSLAVGASYVLLSGDDLDKAAIRVESASKQDDDDQKKVGFTRMSDREQPSRKEDNEDGQREPRWFCVPFGVPQSSIQSSKINQIASKNLSRV